MEPGDSPTQELIEQIEEVYRHVSAVCGVEKISPFGQPASVRMADGFRPLRPDADLAPLLDHTLLKPDATPDNVTKLCEEATRFGFASVCVNPIYVELASELLKDAPANVCSVVGFPLGATTTAGKAAEAAEAVGSGADEIDMVMAIGRLKAGNFCYVLEDIAAVVDAVDRARGQAVKVIVKVIVEACLLTDEEKIAACAMARSAGAAFVKTSTGFAAHGATEHDVRLMRCAVGSDLGVKASGGIRDAEAVRRMIAAGATRLGTSASVAIETEKV